jgi:F-type H+-transporting ATPase subunit gamma
MSTFRQVLSRIKVAKSTVKITKVMQTIATAKLKQNKHKAEASHKLALHYNTMAATIYANAVKMQQLQYYKFTTNIYHGQGCKFVIIISSNKGLCGGLNSNVVREITKHITLNEKAVFYVIGSKIISLLKNKLAANCNIKIVTGTLEYKDSINIADVEQIVHDITTNMQQHNAFNVHIAYTNFVSSLKQEVAIESVSDHLKSTAVSETTIETDDISQFLSTFEVKHLSAMVYNAIRNHIASEHAMRMFAMDNATNNGNKMVAELVLKYNKSRQAAITSELIDIIGGAEVLN